jgi:hypothetical protein
MLGDQQVQARPRDEANQEPSAHTIRYKTTSRTCLWRVARQVCIPREFRCSPAQDVAWL